MKEKILLISCVVFSIMAMILIYNKDLHSGDCIESKTLESWTDQEMRDEQTYRILKVGHHKILAERACVGSISCRITEELVKDDVDNNYIKIACPAYLKE